MFLGINSIYTPVYLPLCEYGQNQPPCADVGLLLNMARTCSFHLLVWAILRSNPPSKEYSVRRDKLSQALNCSCTSELNTGAFTIKLIVNAQVFSSDVQLQFSAWVSCSLLTEYSLGVTSLDQGVIMLCDRVQADVLMNTRDQLSQSSNHPQIEHLHT